MSYLRIYLYVIFFGLFISFSIFLFNYLDHYEISMIKIHDSTFRVEVAYTPWMIERGLSGHPPLAADQGMLFVFGSRASRTFWMKEMNFPLDMIWIDGDRVIGITKNVPAPDSKTPLKELPLYSSPGPATRVLEVNAGTADRIGIVVGDKVE